MKKALILILVAGAIGLHAQDLKFLSKIKLKDGSELHVAILENVPGKYIKIQLPGDTEATIDYDKILSIKHKNYSYQPEFHLPGGVFFEGSTSLLFGRTNEYSGRAGLVLGFTANYRFNSVISIGLGADPSILTGYLLLPIYAHFSGNFVEKRVAPVYFLDAGWSFARANKGSAEEVSTEGGWFVRPGVGMRFNKLTVSLGYQLQEITTTSDIISWWSGDQHVVEERIMKNIVLGISLSF